MATDAAAWFAEAGGIRMDVEHHVGAAAFDVGVGMGGEVVEQAFNFEIGVFGGFGLFG